MRASTYIGTSAKGMVMGIPTKHHNIFCLCRPCLSVASRRASCSAFSRAMALGGKTSSTFSLPRSSSSRRRADRGGTDLRPHSSYGMRRKAWLP